jgi:hypothetical protein
VGVQSDGKIVVAGSTNKGGKIDFALVRYLGDFVAPAPAGGGGGGGSGCELNALHPNEFTPAWVLLPILATVGIGIRRKKCKCQINSGIIDRTP